MEQDLLDRLIQDWRAERPELDASAMGVVGRILRLGNLLESQIGKELRGFGINYTDFDILASLRRGGSPCELTPTSLSHSVLLSSGAMTAALSRLEKAELVRRRVSDMDGRVRLVALTESGRELVDRAIVARLRQADQGVEALTEGERARLGDLLRTMLLALDVSGS